MPTFARELTLKQTCETVREHEYALSNSEQYVNSSHALSIEKLSINYKAVLSLYKQILL